jgi:AhpD family alkylhydroperoxidase
MRFDPYASGQPWYQDLLSLNKHLSDSPLPSSLRQLVEIRVSQITGCGFCLSLHSNYARKTGVTQFKLDTLAGWRDTADFEPRERAALGLAEAMTRIGDGHRVDEATWSTAREHFDDTELAALLYLIGLINVFNRFNIAVELPSDHELPR